MSDPVPPQVLTKGLRLHFLWGDQRVGDFFIPSGQKRVFSVGRAQGVDFVVDDSTLGSERFEVMRSDGQSHTVRFMDTMRGELLRAGETRDLQAVIESGEASHEGGAYALALQEGDVLAVELGGVTLRARAASVPTRVRTPLGESLDFPAINIFLGVFLCASMFVIHASHLSVANDGHAEAFVGNDSRIVRLLSRKAVLGHSTQVVKETSDSASTRTRPHKSAPSSGWLPRGDRLVSADGLTFKPRTKDAVGIVPVNTRCLDGGVGGCVRDIRSGVEVDTSADQATVSGALDKELVCRAVQRNRGQVRFCYEFLLQRLPALSGQLVIRFTLAADGHVSTTSVVQSTTGSAELERCVAGRLRTWTFPPPKDGGSAVVTYPFTFKVHGR